MAKFFLKLKQGWADAPRSDTCITKASQNPCFGECHEGHCRTADTVLPTDTQERATVFVTTSPPIERLAGNTQVAAGVNQGHQCPTEPYVLLHEVSRLQPSGRPPQV